MNRKLTPPEQYDLRKRHRHTKDRRDADKIKAVLMFSDGYTPVEIAEMLLMDEGTVHSWVKSYEEAENVESWLEKSTWPTMGNEVKRKNPQ